MVKAGTERGLIVGGVTASSQVNMEETRII
jgi:hypothetical protein